jgi:hypothetical protein
LWEANAPVPGREQPKQKLDCCCQTGDDQAFPEEVQMVDPVVEALILDLLEWVSKGDRSYQEVMEAWRTSCPKLPVWEDANDRGLLVSEEANGRCVVRLTAAGHALLEPRLIGSHRS